MVIRNEEMERDPIVEETRKLREEYAARFNHDPKAIFDDILKCQSRGGKKLVTFPARKRSTSQPLAQG